MPRKLYIDDSGLGEYANLVQEYMNEKYDTGTTTDNEKAKIYTELKLAVENEKIKSIIVNKEGYITIKTNELIITEPILKRKFYVGSYEIRCHFYGIFKFKSTSEFRNELAFRSGCWRGKTVHPHINSFDGHACLGNAETPMLLFIQQGEVRALISIIIGYLETVNINDSAGKYVGCLPELELDDNGNPIVLDSNADTLEARYLIRTDTVFTREEMCSSNDKGIRGITKSKEYAVASSKYCECCGDLFNFWEIHDHINNYGWVCEECYKDLKICDVCGKIIRNNTDYKTHNDILFCADCATNLLVECAQCGDIITGITKEDLDKITPNNYDAKYNAIKDSIKPHAIYIVDNKLNNKYIYLCDTCRPTIKSNPVLNKLICTDKIETKYEVDISNFLDKNTRVPCSRCSSYFSIGRMFRNKNKIYCNSCAFQVANTTSKNKVLEDDNIIIAYNNTFYTTKEEKEYILNANNREYILPIYILNKENIKEEFLNGSRV